MKSTGGKFEIAMRMNFDDLNASDAHDGDVESTRDEIKKYRTMSTFSKTSTSEMNLKDQREKNRHVAMIVSQRTCKSYSSNGCT
jgi:hypothetical protein